MSNKKQYIEIEKRMTLNLWKDGVADTRENREFQVLKNYIPAQGEIRTREGITLFTHTPDSTVEVWEPKSPDQTYELPPGDFATIQAVFPFNSQATIGMNILSGVIIYSALEDDISRIPAQDESGVCSVYFSDKIEGAASLIITDDTAVNTNAGEPNRLWGMRTANAFPQWMPGGGTSPAQAFLLTWWAKPFTNTGNAEWYFNFGNDANAGVPPMVVRNFDDDFQVDYTSSTGGTVQAHQLTAIIAANQWQFMATWFDFTTGFSGIYHYNATTLAENYNLDENVPVPAGNFYVSSSSNTIGGKVAWNAAAGGFVIDGSQAYHGLMDYVTMWSKPMHINNTSNITLVRAVRDMAWLL